MEAVAVGGAVGGAVGEAAGEAAGELVAPDGFDAFVSARGDALWRSAWLLTGDAQLAEDLVQTALGKCFGRYDAVGPGGFEAYVRRVLFTTYVAWWRRRWNGERPTEVLPEVTSPAADIGLEHDLAVALAALPRGQRAVLVLRFFEDLTERETAALLGISVGTVKSQASRGLKALRDSPVLRQEDHDV